MPAGASHSVIARDWVSQYWAVHRMLQRWETDREYYPRQQLLAHP